MQVLTAPRAEADILRAEVLPLVAQALAIRRQFATLTFDHAQWIERPERGRLPGPAWYVPGAMPPGGVHLLVGTLSQLHDIVPDALSGVTVPHLAIRRVGGSIELIVTGPTAGDVATAARVLAEMDDPLNRVPQVSVLSRSISVDTMSLVSGQVMHPARRYTFEALGTPTTTLAGLGPHNVRVALPVPADFYTAEAATAELLLDFAYGPGLGPGSVMNIMLNGEYIHGVLLDAASGASLSRYVIRIPARRILPGSNVLELDLSLRPELVGGECLSVKGRHLMAQILGSSSITLPPAGATSVQPNLALFAGTGFPYLAPRQKVDGTVVVSSEALLGSALTVIGKLAQAARAPVDGWRITVGLAEHVPGHVLILAPAADLPAEVFSSWSAALGRTVKWPYRVLNDMRGATEPSAAASLRELLVPGRRRSDVEVLRGVVTQDAGLGDLGAIAAFRNPFGEKPATVTLVTARSAELLRTRVHEIIQPELWGQLKGDLALWSGLGEPVITMKVGEHFELGSRDRWLMLRLFLSQNPWYWLAAVLVALITATLSAVTLLQRRRRRLESGL